MSRSSPVALAVLVASIVATLSPARAGATVLVPADLAELVHGAQAIVHGRVIATTSQWRDGRRGVETVVTLEVEDALKGPRTSSISFRVPGGQMGPYRSIMPGAPVFREGEDVIVFLAGDGPSIPHVVGFSQGVYRVRSTAGVRIVRPGVPAAAADATPMTRGAAIRSEPLAAFAARVRALAAAEGVR
jgi:hypothetical protein